MSLESPSKLKVRKRKVELPNEERSQTPKKMKISEGYNMTPVSEVNNHRHSEYDIDNEDILQVRKFSIAVDTCEHVGEDEKSPKWYNLKKYLSRNGPFSHPDFQPSTAFEQLKKIKILVVGAGGLGCEILKNLAMMGFTNIHVMDMDTIDLSNLNRQFLFRKKDIGRSKAEVAAEFIKRRVKGCLIQPYFNKIDDFDRQFYQSFNIVLCGLDSVFARQWVNRMLHSLLRYDKEGQELDYSTITPLLDGGTEGFKGNARVVLPGVNACIDCAKDLYPPKTKYQLCTLANNPRLPEHCVEYVKIVLWPKESPWSKSSELDADNPYHLNWIYEKSLELATHYGITGCTYQLVQGVIKNIIPAVASTNAVIAAACVTEAFKIATNCFLPMSNYLIFNNTDGIYAHSLELQKKEDCSTCSVSPNVIVEESLAITLNDLIKSAGHISRNKFHNPSIIANIEGKFKTLYLSTVPAVEEKTHSNLYKTLQELGFQDGTEFMVADKAFPECLTFQLITPKS